MLSGYASVHKGIHHHIHIVINDLIYNISQSKL